MLVLALLPFFVTDIHALLYEVACSQEGVNLRYPSGKNAGQRNELSPVFAMTDEKMCNTETMDELVVITKCGFNNTIRLYVATGDDSYDVLQVTCPALHDVSVRSRSRRQVIGNKIETEGERLSTTRVTMESKLVFSDLAEIQPIQCSPDDLGKLYIGNPDPYRFRSVLAYDAVSKARCKADMIDRHAIVAIYDCSLSQTVIASFSTSAVHNGIIGGSPDTFRTYKISCYGDEAIPEPTDITLIIRGHGDRLNHSILIWLLLPLLTLVTN